jgi:hypothetical protein
MVKGQFHRSPGIVANFACEDPDGVVHCHFVVLQLEVIGNPLNCEGKEQVNDEKEQELFKDWLHVCPYFLAKYSIFLWYNPVALKKAHSAWDGQKRP